MRSKVLLTTTSYRWVA